MRKTTSISLSKKLQRKVKEYNKRNPDRKINVSGIARKGIMKILDSEEVEE